MSWMNFMQVDAINTNNLVIFATVVKLDQWFIDL